MLPGTPFQACSSAPDRVRRGLSALAAILALLGPTVPVPASTAYCQRAISRASAEYARLHLRLLMRCERQVSAGLRRGPCPDTRTAAALERAQAKASARVDRNCGGDDRRCGVGGDD